MYIPRANQEDRIPVLHRLIEEHPFASLITMGSSGLFASHIPMVLEQNGGMGQLRGHISRANAQWRGSTPPGERVRGGGTPLLGRSACDLLRPAALHHAELVRGKTGDR